MFVCGCQWCGCCYVTVCTSEGCRAGRANELRWVHEGDAERVVLKSARERDRVPEEQLWGARRRCKKCLPGAKKELGSCE
mmetsp:Transcript_17842/g.35857  ORF Transcript_17842/g.35857 Transcript_17842/m.35857 type:complete len:80 (+) Transcript_17842:403-642(+)